MAMTFTDANFDKEVFKAKEPVLVDFWAEWCGPCKMLGPTIEELAKEYSGKIKIGKVNVDENPGISSKFGIRSIPTLLMFKDGEIAGQMMGAQPKASIKIKLDALL
ncbi:MAG: thioredoxin [Candidatus Firestonebacteria bacterium]|nr:thioredoxin [Candidatus Firestonebacteria bacterium]